MRLSPSETEFLTRFVTKIVTRATPSAMFRRRLRRLMPAKPRCRAWRICRASLDPNCGFSIHTRLDDVEDEWRRFQQSAECTAFQSFEWLAAWQRHIGARDGAVPIIVVGRFRRRRNRIHPAARRRDAVVRCGGSAGSARNSAITTRRCWRAISRSASRPIASLRCGASCSRACNPIASCATTGSNSRRCRKRSASRAIPSPASESRRTPTVRT